MALIQVSAADRIGTIAFDNYARRNTLSAAMIAQMRAALDDFRTDHIRAVVLRSASPQPVWSAGHDVVELPAADTDPLPYDDPLEQLLRAVAEFPAPVIAMVQGSAWGGACDLVMTCDLVFGDETCAFAITPAKIGLPYTATGIQHFLNHLPLKIVMEMFCTADPIPAQRAQHVGLVNQLIPAAELEAHTYEIARTIAQRSSEAIAAFKAAARALAGAAPLSPLEFERLHGLRRRVYFGKDYAEGIAAFREKRPPRF